MMVGCGGQHEITDNPDNGAAREAARIAALGVGDAGEPPGRSVAGEEEAGQPPLTLIALVLRSPRGLVGVGRENAHIMAYQTKQKEGYLTLVSHMKIKEIKGTEDNGR
jgi:hypothetical protein